MVKYPPHNQRRLNVKIRQVYRHQYKDWYDLATSMQEEGQTLQDIAERFAILGVSVSYKTVHDWIKRREKEEKEAA